MGRRRQSSKQQRRQALRRVPIIPGWIRAGLITGALLIVIIVANSLAGELSPVCYAIQFIAFLGNGLLAAYFEQDTFRKKRQFNPRTYKPSYMAVGAGAGFIVSIIASIIYLIVWSQLGALLPPGLDLLVSSPLALIAIDSIAAIGLGMIGGPIGGQIF